MGEACARSGTDVIVINPATGQVWDALIEQYKPVTKIWQYGFVIFSRHRAVRFGYQILGVDEGVGFDPRTGRSRAKRRDPGRAMLLQLDTTAATKDTTTYWLIDLPSDISLHRRVVVEEAAEALRNFDGQVIDFDADGTAHRASRGGRGFPPPDVILGDFNIPRGSGSLARLGADLVPAYSVAGRGMSRRGPTNARCGTSTRCWSTHTGGSPTTGRLIPAGARTWASG